MNRTTETRIVRLEGRLRPARCQTCRSWGDNAFEVRTSTGEVRLAARPETCASCGRVVPIQMRRSYVIYEDADDYAA